MKRVIRLTENDIRYMVHKVLNESNMYEDWVYDAFEEWVNACKGEAYDDNIDSEEANKAAERFFSAYEMSKMGREDAIKGIQLGNHTNSKSNRTTLNPYNESLQTTLLEYWFKGAKGATKYYEYTFPKQKHFILTAAVSQSTANAIKIIRTLVPRVISNYTCAFADKFAPNSSMSNIDFNDANYSDVSDDLLTNIDYGDKKLIPEKGFGAYLNALDILLENWETLAPIYIHATQKDTLNHLYICGLAMVDYFEQIGQEDFNHDANPKIVVYDIYCDLCSERDLTPVGVNSFYKVSGLSNYFNNIVNAIKLMIADDDKGKLSSLIKSNKNGETIAESLNYKLHMVVNEAVRRAIKNILH